MPGVGVGGLLAGLFNPGLDDRLAQHITPNPNPLAQQGQAVPGAVDNLGNPVAASGPPAGPQQPNLAPAAVTAPDPVNASYAADLLRAHRLDQLSADFNQGLDSIAASFGTAQQQQSKQQALARGGGGVGDSLAALHQIQGMQDQTIQDNEHARFTSNAAIFAQTLSTALGRPVSVAEAQEIQNNPRLLEQYGGAASGAEGSNAQTTNTVKDAEAATRAYAAAHPEATAKDIADYKANLIAGGMGGSDLAQRQYLAERSAGLTTDDFLTWKSKHEAQAKEQDATAVNIANAKKVLPGINTSIGNMTKIADSVLDREDLLKGILADKNKVRWANDIMKADPKSNVALNAQQQGGLSTDEVTLIQDVSQLHNMNYRGAFSGEGGVKGIRSQVEADRVSRAADQLANFTDANTYLKNIRRLKSTYSSAAANAAGEAQALDQIPEGARYKLDPSFFEGGANAPKALPDWARVQTVSSKADWDRLAVGQAYRAPGSEHKNQILIKGYEQQAMDDEDN